MKIVHLCVSNFYVDGYSYQENELIRQHIRDGHEVVVIASTETFGSDRKLSYVSPGRYVGKEGAQVTRVAYRNWLPQRVMRKLRIHPGIFNLLEQEAPDVIFFHSICGWELLTATKYKKKYPNVRLFADSHEDFNNSARNWLSKYLLHYLYYRSIAKLSLPSFEKVLCISVETIEFVRDFYGIAADALEFYPLGALVYNDEEYLLRRMKGREQHRIAEDEVLFVQSGKMDASKKVAESIRAFTRTKSEYAKFLLAGSIDESIRVDVEAAIRRDPRIRFIGWQSPQSMQDLLCAADLYVQPGTQSATMQLSLGARCPVAIADVPSHKPYVQGNGWLLGPKCSLDDVFAEALSSRADLTEMARRSGTIAMQLLDYRKLASRVY